MLGEGAPRIEGFKVIWRQTPKVTGNGHFAHRIAFARDGTHVPVVGRAAEIRPGAGVRRQSRQDPPFDRRGAAGRRRAVRQPRRGRREFYTMGHRNNLGLAFAPDGRLWATEMGPKGGDELNLIEAGQELRLSDRVERQPL